MAYGIHRRDKVYLTPQERDLLTDLINNSLEGLREADASMYSDPVINNVETLLELYGDSKQTQLALHEIKEKLNAR